MLLLCLTQEQLLIVAVVVFNTGTASSVDLQDNDLVSVAHRLTTLEMKELNERQRAEHASRMYEQQKGILRQLEDRNFELERKFAEVFTKRFSNCQFGEFSLCSVCLMQPQLIAELIESPTFCCF